MPKRNIRADKKKNIPYTRKSFSEIFAARKESYLARLNKKAGEYLDLAYKSDSVSAITDAEGELEQLLAAIPEIGKIEPDEPEPEKQIISSLKQYRKLRKTMSYEEIQENYVGEKPRSLIGFESQYNRKKKRKGNYQRKKPGPNPYMTEYTQYKKARNKGYSNSDIREGKAGYRVKNNYMLGGWGRRYAKGD